MSRSDHSQHSSRTFSDLQKSLNEIQHLSHSSDSPKSRSRRGSVSVTDTYKGSPTLSRKNIIKSPSLTREDHSKHRSRRDTFPHIIENSNAPLYELTKVVSKNYEEEESPYQNISLLTSNNKASLSFDSSMKKLSSNTLPQVTLPLFERQVSAPSINTADSKCSECQIPKKGVIECSRCRLFVCLECHQYGHVENFQCNYCRKIRCLYDKHTVKNITMCWPCSIRHVLLEVDLSTRDVIHVFRDNVLQKLLELASRNRRVTYTANHYLSNENFTQ